MKRPHFISTAVMFCFLMGAATMVWAQAQAPAQPAGQTPVMAPVETPAAPAQAPAPAAAPAPAKSPAAAPEVDPAKIQAVKDIKTFTPEVKTAIDKSLKDPEHAAGTVKVIDPAKPVGILGIPGAPDPNLIAGLLWAVWVGWIFSTVGAFGGIMAGVGHISVFGLGEYAGGFGKGNPVGKLLTDSIRVSNQWLVGLSAFISSINYYKMGRLVLPLALCLSIGAVAGAYLNVELTAAKVDFKAYQGWFGLCVMVLGSIILYETTPKGQASKKQAKEAAAAFEKHQKEGGAQQQEGVKLLEGKYGPMLVSLALVVAGSLLGSLSRKFMPKDPNLAYFLYTAYALMGIGLLLMPRYMIRFSFYGVEFSFRAYIPVLGGLVIFAISSFLGVGGGFLVVPFLTSVAGLPMFLVAGTSGLSVLVGMVASIGNFMVGQGVNIPWAFVGMELVGIFVGSMIGPRTSKYIPDIWLKRLFVVLAAYVGIGYLLAGFFKFKLPGI